MYENVIPFKKYDRFQLTLGTITNNGEVIEKDPVGFAFLKPGSKMFRLKIWAHPQVNYFLAQDDVLGFDHYQVLALEEYQTAQGDLKTNWNKVGKGQLVGNFIKISVQFFSDDFFLCLFPINENSKEANVAV